jgi:hypothetical protein
METRLTYTLHGITISVGDLLPVWGGTIVTNIVRYPYHKFWSVEYQLLQENIAFSRRAHELTKHLHKLHTIGFWSPAA